MSKRDLDPLEMNIASDLAKGRGGSDFTMNKLDGNLAIVAARAERILAELDDSPLLRVVEVDTENGKRHVTIHFTGEHAPQGYGATSPFQITSGGLRYFDRAACRKLEGLFDWTLRENGKDPNKDPLLRERFSPATSGPAGTEPKKLQR